MPKCAATQRPRAAASSLGSIDSPLESRIAWVVSIIGSIFSAPRERPSLGSSSSNASMRTET